MSGFNLSASSSLNRGAGTNASGVRRDTDSKYAGQTPYQRESFGAPASSPQSPGQNFANAWNGWNTPAQAPKPSLTSPSPSPQPSASPTSWPPRVQGNSISNFASSFRAAPTPQPQQEFKPTPVVRTTQAKPTPKASTTTPGLAPTLSARYTDPAIDRIALQLHQVQNYKSCALLSSCAFLVIGIVLVVVCLKLPMPKHVWIFNRLTVQLVGVILGALFVYLGVDGLFWYRSLQVPAQALEGLTEKQKRLMGWTSGGPIGPSDPATQQAEQDRAPGAAFRRRQQSQLSSSPQPPATGRSSTAPASAASSNRNDASNARNNLSPIPTASLRFLDPTGGARSPNGFVGNFHNPNLGSPFRTRGLDQHHVTDEADLQELVNNRSMRDERFGSNNAALLTPPSAASSAARYGGTVSPRGGGGYGYDAGSDYLGTSSVGGGFQTPPYATSVREVLATPVVVASASSTSSSQPFVYPGLRHVLEDPRSDFELHDLFGQTLSTVRKSTQDFDQSTRRMRAWLVSTILRPFLRYMEQTTLAMSNAAQRLLANHQMTTHFTKEELQLFRELSTLASDVQRGHAAFQTSARIEEAIALIRARFPKNVEGLNRRGVEVILSCVPRPDSKVTPQTKEYVAKRLAHLCAPGDDSLSKFSVGVVGAPQQAQASLFGSSQQSGLFGQTRSMPAASASAAAGPVSAFPSDAQLILHCFVSHMDTVAPGFALQYVRDAADGTSTGVSCLPRTNEPTIVQVRPAHLAPYFVVAKASTTTTLTAAPASAASSRAQCPVKFLTEPGRPSLFQALVLWVMELPANSRLGREFTGIVTES